MAKGKMLRQYRWLRQQCTCFYKKYACIITIPQTVPWYLPCNFWIWADWCG